MKCKIIGQHLRVLSKAVRLLSKISNTVLITTNSNGLKLQSLNEHKSAFVEIQLENRFFASFESSVDTLCTINLKSLILVFRMVNMDKIVESCTIIMDNSMPRVVFQMKCKRGVTREYFLPYMESDVYRYSSNSLGKTPTFKAQSKVLSEAFQHFAQFTRDITLWLHSDQILFKSYFEEDDQNLSWLPMTSFSYKSNEFLTYNFTNEITITFNVRDLKSFLEFASYQNQCVNSFFEASGKPIEFTINNSVDCYSAKLILATFDFPDNELPIPPSNQLSHTSFSVVGSNETSNNDFTTSYPNDSHNSSHMPSIPSNSGLNQNTSEPSISNANVVSNETADEDEDDFDDDDVFEQMLSGMPDFSRNQSNETPETTNESLFALTGSALAKYHKNVLFGSEDEDSPVASGEDVIVPDSDEETL